MWLQVHHHPVAAGRARLVPHLDLCRPQRQAGASLGRCPIVGRDVVVDPLVEHVLEVYRDGQYVGRAVVTSVTSDRAVARLVKAYARGVVQRGDRVTTRLKA